MQCTYSSNHLSAYMSWLSATIRSWTGRKKSQPDYGLHSLVEQDQHARECVDIVAIHGLNGHYLNTWTDEASGVNWLSDIIPKVVESLGQRARVMSFFYNSTLQFSKSTSDVTVFADQLLECLNAERRTGQEINRPIIFICHSLGGIVFKQAFVRAREKNQYNRIGSQFKGVIFFGTPHKGSKLASMASILAMIVRAMTLGTTTNVRLSRDLEPNTRIIDHISDSFQEQCKALTIVSCFELEKMSGLSCLVVEKQSATLGLRDEIRIGLNSNHRTMCKFTDVNARGFRAVKTRLEELVEGAMGSKLAQNSEDFINSLYTSDYTAHKNRNPLPVPKTCTWIFENSNYKSWKDAPVSALLWISANAGDGKSVLASYLVDKLTQGEDGTGESTNVCYFFFKSDNTEQSDAVHGMQAILHQIYNQQKQLVVPGIGAFGGRSIDNLDHLWDALVLSASHPRARNIVCILDGLDECEPKSCEVLLRAISELFAGHQTDHARVDRPRQGRQRTTRDNHEASGQSTPTLKMIVTSRPETRIKRAFDIRPWGTNATETPKIFHLTGENETEARCADISKVVEAKIASLGKIPLPENFLERIRTELIKRADRTFLWVSLILNLLEDKVESDAGLSRRELDELLESRSIYAIYKKLLASRPDLLNARKMLNIILATTRPLTAEELSIALAVPPDEDTPSSRMVTFDVVEDNISYPFEDHVKYLCGHFIRIIRNRVYLVHQTAREFLLPAEGSDSGLIPMGENWTTGPSFQHSFLLEEAHFILFNICSTYLYCLGREPYRGHPPPSNAAPFLQYAAKSWPTHYTVVRNSRPRLDWDYYDNLLHPKFPGFKCWMNESHLPFSPPGSGNAVQNFYVGYLQSQPEIATNEYSYNSSIGFDSGDNGASRKSGEDRDSDKEANENSEKTRLKTLAAAQALDVSSANPTSVREFYFPQRADERGRVQLDFGSTGFKTVKTRKGDFY
ncbi:hypothetical protein F5Y11DRAFT_323386 [Daldinia sp. FL1419]|nr:hypothetical protein F5Y11DRAFT_323386 [Daldinia sp. FL1419]